MKRYVFVKPYTAPQGTIAEGSEITLFRGFYYLNGGMILPAYVKYIEELFKNKQLFNEYLREVVIPYNKI